MFEDHFQRIDKPMSIHEFYPLLAPIMAEIGCGHANLWPPDGYWDSAPDRMFPVQIHFSQDEKIWVLHTFGIDPGIPPGSEIISINKQPAGEIIQTLLLDQSADGYNRSLKLWKLNNRFQNLFALHYGFPSEYEIGYLYQGKKKKIILPPIQRETIRDHFKPEHDSTWFDNHLKFEILEDYNTALIKLKTFAYYSENKKFKSFIDQSFKEIRDNSIQNLILDLRDNDGGDPFCSVHVLAYIEPEPIPYFSRPYGKYSHMAKPIPMAKHPYTGELFILIDGGGLSTTGHFTSVLKYNHVGTFIGLETGGTYTCNNASKMINLDHTQYYVNCPRATFATAVSGFPPDRGIMPDIEVEPSVEDIINGKDTMMEIALAKIKE